MRSHHHLVLAAVVAVLSAGLSSAQQVWINEVAYADEGSEDREFVELYNSSSTALALGSWTLRVTEVGTAERVLATIPLGTNLPGRAFYVIGSPGLAGVDLPFTRFDMLPNGPAFLALHDATGTRRSSLVWESSQGLGQLAEAEGIWGAFLSTDTQPISWGRVRDGYNTQNERDFVLMPATVGSSNDLPRVLPYQKNFDTAPTGAVQNEFYGTRALMRAIDPGVVSSWQLEAVPASPQGGRIAIFGDDNTHGSVLTLLADGIEDASFDAWVYLDARPLQSGERAAWSIGVRGSSAPEWVPPAVGGLTDLSNGNTGVSWTYIANASGAKLYLIDHNDGGYGANAQSTPRVLGEIPLILGVNDGWQRLELAAFGPQVFGKVGASVFGGTTTPALGTLYLAQHAAVSHPIRTRYIRVDEPQAKAFGDPIPFFVPVPSITTAGFPVQLQDMSLGAPDEYDWNFGNGSGQCCNIIIPPASACTNTPVPATGAACKSPTTTYPNPVGPVPGVHFPTLKVKRLPNTWAPPCAVSLVCVYPKTTNDDAPFLMYLPFNEVRGQVVCNAAGSTGAPELMLVSTPNWQVDPQRAGFKGNEPGAGAIGGGNSATVDSDFPLELCGSTTIFWGTKMMSTPTQEVAFCGAGPGGTFRITTGGSIGDRLAFSGTSIGRLVSAQNLQALGQWRDCALVIDNLAGAARFWFDGQPDGNALFFTPGTFRERQGGTFRIGDHVGTPATAHFAIDAFGIDGDAASPQRIARFASGEAAHWCRFGTACAPQVGTAAPSAYVTNPPQIGTTVGVGVKNAPSGDVALLIVGFGAQHIAGTPIALPLPLPAPFAAGCDLLVSLDVPLNAGPVPGNGQSVVAFPIPMDPLISGAHAYAQWLFLNASSSSASDAVDLALR